MRRLFLILVILSAGVASYGQQLPIFSQYLYNKFLMNPAVAGSDGYTSFSLTAREQWVGYSGAPRTFSFSAQTRILKKGYSLKASKRRNVYRPGTDGRVGLGGYVFSDRNGLVQRTGFQASYAYHMWLQNSTQLSFGLALTGYHYRLNEQAMNFEQPDDPWMFNNLRRGMFVPDASFGAYLLNAKYCVGFSADQLFGASTKIANNAYNNFRMNRHFYLFGSYDFTPDGYSIIQPSFNLMMSEQFHPQADLGATYIYDQHVWGGLAYRTSGALIATLGMRYENIFIGYAFDFTTNEIQRVTYGTHEITFAVKLGDNSRRYRWLERY
jgi:type IX secretion system PorP/SprF family membrane protein